MSRTDASAGGDGGASTPGAGDGNGFEAEALVGEAGVVPNGPFEWLTNFDSLRHLLDPAFLFPPSARGDDGSPEEGGGGSVGTGSSLRWNHLRRRRRRRVLNIGCGTSTIGESLVEQLGYCDVVNADVDDEALRTMERRWKERMSSRRGRENDNDDYSDGGDDAGGEESKGSMRWARMDFSAEGDEAAERETDELLGGRTFDVVLDKSTLDCALCSDDAVSGLLCRAYRSLRSPDAKGDDDDERGGDDSCFSGGGKGEGGGVYVVVSFHPKEFILPLLRDCPGAHWDVRHYVVRRDVDVPEHLVGRRGFEKKFQEEKKEEEDLVDSEGDGFVWALPEGTFESAPSPLSVPTSTSAWRDGTFSPDDQYRRTANVFLCQKRRQTMEKYREGSGRLGGGLERDVVREHVHRTNDDWFRVHNPMVTHAREADLRRAFEERLVALGGYEARDRELKREGVLPLRDCYGILFTDAEREHLEYSHFLEDWEAFISGDCGEEQEREDLCRGMTVDLALRFLEEMQ